VDHRTVLVITLHGFGSNPEAMLRLSAPAVGQDSIVASLRAPNQQYLTASPMSDGVAYNWGTRAHPDFNIRLHHDILRTVAAKLRERFAIPAHRRLVGNAAVDDRKILRGQPLLRERLEVIERDDARRDRRRVTRLARRCAGACGPESDRQRGSGSQPQSFPACDRHSAVIAQLTGVQSARASRADAG